ncbi:hypothetical protein AAH012_05890, partial [Bacteroides fragilis]
TTDKEGSSQFHDSIKFGEHSKDQCIALGLVALFSAIRQGQVCANGIAAIGQGHNVFSNTLILAVFPELYAIVALAATFLIGSALA